MGEPYFTRRKLPSSPHRRRSVPIAIPLLLIVSSQLTWLVAAQRNVDPLSTPRPSHYAPKLKVQTPNGYLNLSAAPGTTVRISPDPQSPQMRIEIEDEDLALWKQPAQYEFILSGPGADNFGIKDQGQLYLISPIAANSQHTYTITVVVREIDTYPLRSSGPLLIDIHIIEENKPPAFPKTYYEANVSASGREKVVIQDLVAYDPDGHPDSSLTYRIAGVEAGGLDASSWFKFKQYSAEKNALLAVGALVPGQKYQVKLEAKDQDGLTAQTTIHVQAVPAYTAVPFPILDHTTKVPYPIATPTFGSTVDQPTVVNATIYEDAPPGTVVVDELESHYVAFIRKLQNKNEWPNLDFKIIRGNEDGLFEIKPENYRVVTAPGSHFSRQRQQTHVLHIASYRNISLIDLIILQITIKARNKHYPPQLVDPHPLELKFELYGDAFEQESPKIGQIRVGEHGAEKIGHLHLSILPPEDSLFTINDQGDISIRGTPTKEHLRQHAISVKAQYDGQPPVEKKVIISIEGNSAQLRNAPESSSAPVSGTSSSSTGDYSVGGEIDRESWQSSPLTRATLPPQPAEIPYSQLPQLPPTSHHPPETPLPGVEAHGATTTTMKFEVGRRLASASDKTTPQMGMGVESRDSLARATAHYYPEETTTPPVQVRENWRSASATAHYYPEEKPNRFSTNKKEMREWAGIEVLAFLHSIDWTNSYTILVVSGTVIVVVMVVACCICLCIHSRSRKKKLKGTMRQGKRGVHPASKAPKSQKFGHQTYISPPSLLHSVGPSHNNPMHLRASYETQMLEVPIGSEADRGLLRAHQQNSLGSAARAGGLVQGYGGGLRSATPSTTTTSSFFSDQPNGSYSGHHNLYVHEGGYYTGNGSAIPTANSKTSRSPPINGASLMSTTRTYRRADDGDFELEQNTCYAINT